MLLRLVLLILYEYLLVGIRKYLNLRKPVWRKVNACTRLHMGLYSICVVLSAYTENQVLPWAYETKLFCVYILKSSNSVGLY